MMSSFKLRRVREQHGWSQAHIAREVGTDARTVSRWERGVTSPSPHFRERLCQLFQLDAETLGLLSPIILASPSTSKLTREGPIIDPAHPPLMSPFTQIIGRETLLDTLFSGLEEGTIHTFYGLPGVGKTTLAHMVSQDSRCKVLFPDGLLWISLGPTPDIQSELLRLAELVQVPEQQRTQEHTREEWLQHIHHAIGVRRLLIIIDDAWSVSAIQSFIFESRQVAYLITTRLPGVAFALSRGEVYLIPELNEQQSRQLLEHQVPLFQYVAEDLVQQVLQICGGLPLALTLLNRTLRREFCGWAIQASTSCSPTAD